MKHAADLTLWTLLDFVPCSLSKHSSHSQHSVALLGGAGRGMHLPLPPGLVIEPGEKLGSVDALVEWVIYMHEERFGMLVAISIAAALYDMLWTPCLFLLANEVDNLSLSVGIGIDAIFLLGLSVSCFVWGPQGRLLSVALQLLECLPWELVGLASEPQEATMWARFLAKVRACPRMLRQAAHDAPLIPRRNTS